MPSTLLGVNCLAIYLSHNPLHVVAPTNGVLLYDCEILDFVLFSLNLHAVIDPVHLKEDFAYISILLMTRIPRNELNSN